MMVFHGTDQVASRREFQAQKESAKKSGKILLDLPGPDVTLPDLVTSTASVSLLGNTTSIFIEELFSRRPSNEKTSVLEWLKVHTDSEITVWESKDVSSLLKSFPPPIIKKFDLPKSVWQFLDFFSIQTFREAAKNTEPEQILALLASRLQQLILVHEGLIPEKLASWQAARLRSQAAKFSLDTLGIYNRQLLDIDLKQKTSSSPTDLAGALELWLMKNVI